MTQSVPVSPVLLLLLFVGGWLFVSGVLAITGGWRRLAESFSAPDGFACNPVDRFRLRSIKVGAVHYGSCVTVGITDQGLYLSVLPPFRFMHPPLLIPWRAIATVEERRVLWARWIRLETADGFTIQLPWGLGDLAREQRMHLHVAPPAA